MTNIQIYSKIISYIYPKINLYFFHKFNIDRQSNKKIG